MTIAQPDPCLALYPAATWAEICGRLEAAQHKDARYRKFVRHLFAHTEEVGCDSQGRIVIPPALRAFAGIERDVVSIGSLTRVELWARDRVGDFAPSAEDAAELAAALGLY
jgi:MraZ protein